jgi:asparagine synthase (glutamine-hydrolysing)
MCGIAGIVDFNSPPPSEQLLRRMLGLLRHRGPDAFGIYLGEQAGLAHARLSIIDLSGGDQPIHNEDRTIWIVYNGEVFNYPELRSFLEARGHRFYTNTDTEVLVHLYEEKGPEMLSDLNGQFAFALWDKRVGRLLLARDRLGIRPLFYHYQGGRLAFGSEIKSLFADSRIPRSINPQTVSDVFTCWTPLANLTAFQDIYQVPPGHYALFSQTGMFIHPYWQLSFSRPETGERPLSEWVEELKGLLSDATRIRLRADVAVGAYLSGGLDSTYITSMVKQFFNNELRTFSVSFRDERFDEAPYQEKAVQALRTEHRRIRCTEHDIGESFPSVIWHTEVPMLRTAPAPLYQLSHLVRANNFKVVLTGEGSDEIFAGYDIFKEDRVRRFWARQPDSTMRPALFGKLYPDIFASGNKRSRMFLESFFRKGLTNIDSPVYSHFIRWENTSQLKGFFSEGMREAVHKEGPFEERFIATLPPEFMTWDPLSRAQYTEITLFLSNYLLSSQGDRMAMAHAVEGRFPFLDHRVVEFACRIPPRYRMLGLKEKFILRKAAADLMPPELAQRPKQPYRAPISRSFLGNPPHPYVEDLLSERAIREAGYFDSQRVKALTEKCRKNEGRLLSERENMGLVGIISTQLLYHLFVEDFPRYPVVEPEHVPVFRQEKFRQDRQDQQDAKSKRPASRPLA